MALRLKRRGSIAEQLERLIRKEFRTALEDLALPTLDEGAIHEARTSVKKIRAVLRVLHDELGSCYRTENRRLRSAAHSLAGLRDVDATVETLRALHNRYPRVVPLSVTRAVGRGLPTRGHRARARTGHAIARAARALRQSSQSAPHHARRVAHFAAVRAGVTRGYRRARNAMKHLALDSGAIEFHRWRRRVKDHRHHMQLFAGIHAEPRSRANRMDQLDAWLGEDHDLAILRAAILATKGRFADARTTALVLGGISKYRAWLRARALKLGRRAFARTPDQFERSVTEWWRRS